MFFINHNIFTRVQQSFFCITNPLLGRLRVIDVSSITTWTAPSECTTYKIEKKLFLEKLNCVCLCRRLKFITIENPLVYLKYCTLYVWPYDVWHTYDVKKRWMEWCPPRGNIPNRQNHSQKSNPKKIFGPTGPTGDRCPQIPDPHFFQTTPIESDELITKYSVHLNLWINNVAWADPYCVKNNVDWPPLLIRT